MRVRKFNRTKPPPDVQMEDWHLWARGEDFAHTEMGYRAMGDHVNDFLQKQVKDFKTILISLFETDLYL